jgi:hypothetical protein
MDEAVWIDTTDGDLLRQLFGHYPTLHEARFTGLEIDRSSGSVFADVEYQDETEPGDEPLRVRMRLEWHGVKELDLQVTGVEILSVQFSRDGALLTTHLVPCSGTQGKIVSERFEAVLTQAHSLRNETESIRIRMR